MLDSLRELEGCLSEMKGISPRSWPGRTRLFFVLELLRHEDEDVRRMAAVGAARAVGYEGYIPWPKQTISEGKIREGDYWVPRSIEQLEQGL